MPNDTAPVAAPAAPAAPDAAPAPASAAPTPQAIAEFLTAARDPFAAPQMPLLEGETAEPAPAQEPAPAAPVAKAPKEGEPEKFSFAELAEQERTLRQRERAVGVRYAELQREAARLQEQQQGQGTREEKLAALRADPDGFLQREYGLSLQDVATYVAQGSAPVRREAPEIRELREQLEATQARIQQFEQEQQQTVSHRQHAEARAGLMAGLEQAKDSYPLLLGMLGPERAADAIVQGVTASYSGDSFKTADEVAQELEKNLRPIADRLITAHPKLTAPNPPPSPPTPPPRLSNRSTASPVTAPPRLRREDLIDQVAQSLRFVEK